MAGRRHHILPRFLLKGFAKEIRGDQIYVWEYAKDRKPLPLNIINVGVEGDYYGGPRDEVQADNAITEMESAFSTWVDELRNAEGPVPGAQAANFVAHLSSRTKHLRLSFQESADQLMQEMADLVGDEDQLAQVLRPVVRDEAFLGREFTKSLPPHMQSPDQVRRMLPVIRRLAEQFLEANKGSIARQMSATIQSLRGTLAQSAATGQNRALLNFGWEMPKAKLWENMDWRTEHRTEPLVLGDSGCLFAAGDVPRLYPYPEDPKAVEAIYLPISKHLLIVGEARADRPAPRTLVLNEAAASCSRHFFVSGEAPEIHGNLQALIGSQAVFFPREQIARIARECFANMAKSLT